MVDKSSRWDEAQKFEYHEWTTIPNVIEREWNEVKNKFSKLFKEVETTYSFNESYKILDVGCGPTCVARLFSTGHKTGIDPLADKLNYSGNMHDMEVISGTAEKLPFKENVFDVAICINAIDHTDSPEKALKEISRVMKPGGIVLLSCYTYNPFIYLIKLFSEKTGFIRNVAHPHTFTPKALSVLMSQSFKIEREILTYEGKSPTDYGKSYAVEEKNPFFTNIVLFINYKLLRQKYFVREMTIIAKKQA